MVQGGYCRRTCERCDEAPQGAGGPAGELEAAALPADSVATAGTPVPPEAEVGGAALRCHACAACWWACCAALAGPPSLVRQFELRLPPFTRTISHAGRHQRGLLHAGARDGPLPRRPHPLALGLRCWRVQTLPLRRLPGPWGCAVLGQTLHWARRPRLAALPPLACAQRPPCRPAAAPPQGNSNRFDSFEACQAAAFEWCTGQPAGAAREDRRAMQLAGSADLAGPAGDAPATAADDDSAAAGTQAKPSSSAARGGPAAACLAAAGALALALL